MFKTMKSPMMLGWVLGVLLLALPVFGWAGDDEQDQPRLTVSAEGKMNVPPDKAVLSFAVETVGGKLAKVQEENQERMARVLKECRQLKIPSKFIQTTSLNVIPEYPPPVRGDLLVGRWNRRFLVLLAIEWCIRSMLKCAIWILSGRSWTVC